MCQVYRKHDLVDYWSVSHGEWLPATVVNTDLEGRIVIDLKPNTWLTKEERKWRLSQAESSKTKGTTMENDDEKDR